MSEGGTTHDIMVCGIHGGLNCSSVTYRRFETSLTEVNLFLSINRIEKPTSENMYRIGENRDQTPGTDSPSLHVTIAAISSYINTYLSVCQS